MRQEGADREAVVFASRKILSKAVEMKDSSEALKGMMILNNWAIKQQIQFNADNVKQDTGREK